MTTVDEKKLEETLEKKKWDEARNILRQYTGRGLSREERGAAYVNFAYLYLRMNNQISLRYLRVLENSLATLRELAREEQQLDDRVALLEARKRIERIE